MVVKHHGIPKTIVSDKDKKNSFKFWKELHRISGTTLSYSSAYHPKSDWKTKVMNKCIESYLRANVYDNPRRWLQMLPWVELLYNTTYYSSLGMSPYQVLYGREPPTIVQFESGKTSLEVVEMDLL